MKSFKPRIQIKSHPQSLTITLYKSSTFAEILRKSRPGTSLALFLLYFLGICIKSYAVEPPEIAIIQTVYGSRLTVFPNGRNSSPAPAREGTELREFRGILAVPGNNQSKAGLMLVNARRQPVSSSAQTLFMAGPKDTPTEYSLSCKIAVGAATVGFSQGQAPCDKGVIVTPYRNIVGQFPAFKPAEIAQKLKNFLKAQASVDSIQYCSTVADSGRGWGVSSSQNPSDDPCQQAREKCLQTSSGQECDIVSLGEWNSNDSEVVASVQCANNLAFTRRGNGQEVSDELLPLLEQMGKSLNASSCAFHVYSANDIVVSPASNNPTLVQLYDAGGGNLAIDVLVGDVNIVSAQRPQGLRIQEGFGYRQDRNGLTRIDCPERFNSESMQDFLQPDHWSSDRGVTTQLAEYRTDFCQSAGRSRRSSPDIDLPPIRIPIPFPRTPRDDNDNRRPSNDSRQSPIDSIPIRRIPIDSIPTIEIRPNPGRRVE